MTEEQRCLRPQQLQAGATRMTEPKELEQVAATGSSKTEETGARHVVIPGKLNPNFKSTPQGYVRLIAIVSESAQLGSPFAIVCCKTIGAVQRLTCRFKRTVYVLFVLLKD